jgi:hypothetical protein
VRKKRRPQFLKHDSHKNIDGVRAGVPRKELFQGILK